MPGQTQSLLVSSPLLTPHGLDLQLVLSLVAVRPRALGALLPWPALLLVMLDLRKSDVGWGEWEARHSDPHWLGNLGRRV